MAKSRSTTVQVVYKKKHISNKWNQSLWRGIFTPMKKHINFPISNKWNQSLLDPLLLSYKKYGSIEGREILGWAILDILYMKYTFSLRSFNKSYLMGPICMKNEIYRWVIGKFFIFIFKHQYDLLSSDIFKIQCYKNMLKLILSYNYLIIEMKRLIY